MKCPHCRVEFHDQVQTFQLGQDRDGYWSLHERKCPACNRFVMELASYGIESANGVVRVQREPSAAYLVRPKVASRPAPPSEVPAEFARDYIEASLVMADSPQSSAALSRRCLQSLLREMAGVTKGNLAKEIDEVLASGKLPSHLAKAIDAVRNIGNFAAHPIKSTNTGEILPVEAGEAEWTLDVLDGLFDFYFVQPAFLEKKRETLNAKLESAGKPPIKG